MTYNTIEKFRRAKILLSRAKGETRDSAEFVAAIASFVSAKFAGGLLRNVAVRMRATFEINRIDQARGPEYGRTAIVTRVCGIRGAKRAAVECVECDISCDIGVGDELMSRAGLN